MNLTERYLAFLFYFCIRKTAKKPYFLKATLVAKGNTKKLARRNI